MKWSLSLGVLFLAVGSLYAQSVIEKTNTPICPNFQLQCPDCAEDETCVYPNSGGCPNAGVPVCKSNHCLFVCEAVTLLCPQECPTSCVYSSPPCCPFNGKPDCVPVCNTLVPCQVTPCPDDCPNSCFYPNADNCCPYAGQPKGPMTNYGQTPSSTPSIINGLPVVVVTEIIQAGHLGQKCHPAVPSATDGVSVVVVTQTGTYPDPNANNWGQAYSAKSWAVHRDRREVYGEPFRQGGDHHGEYYYGYPLPPPFKQHHHREHHCYDDDNYVEGVFIGGPPQADDHHCPTCTKTMTDYDISLEFVTTTRTSNDILCAQYMIPCPLQCPYDCAYPMDQPCPFSEQPWCPSVIGNEPVTDKEEFDTVFVTEGYPFPYFPTYDPYHNVFTSILNDSGVTSTPSFVTEQPTFTPAHFCPLIFRMCPIECPDSCFRPDVSCPFAAEGYCPGSSPTITKTDTVTPTQSTFVGTGLVCPLYILACPVCPEDYGCTRATTGNCPNTNVPYCISTITPEGYTINTASGYSRVFEYYPATPTPTATLYHYKPPPPHYKYGGYQLFESLDQGEASFSLKEPKLILDVDEFDMCERNGYTRVDNPIIFEQLQEQRVGCEHCPYSDWNEDCENTCVYRIEDNCCIQALCLVSNDF